MKPITTCKTVLERVVKVVFSFPHLMTNAKHVLPPSEKDWLVPSDHGDKQCYTIGSCSSSFAASCRLIICCSRGEREMLIRTDELLLRYNNYQRWEEFEFLFSSS